MDRNRPPESTSKEDLALALSAFNRYDADGSGTVDHEEIVQIIRLMGFTVEDPASKMKRAVRKLSAVAKLKSAPSHQSPQLQSKEQEIPDSVAGEKSLNKVQVSKKAAQGTAKNDNHMVFSQAQVKKLISDVDHDNSGAIEWGEFLIMWQTLQHMKHTADLQTMFNNFDKDGGGSIDNTEVRALLKTVGLHPSDEVLQKMIDEADDDHTGHVEFDEFLKLWEHIVWEFKWSNRVVELRRRSTEHYFEAAQVKRVLEQIEDSSQRVQAFLIFYERIIDEENMVVALEALKFEEVTQLQIMLGPLTLMNPLAPDGMYKLDLSLNDCWICARVLTDLADVEPGENWFGERFNDKDFEFSEMWIKETPKKGVLELRYGCAKGNEDMPYRKDRCEQVLGWEFDDDYDEQEMLQKARHNAEVQHDRAKVIEDALQAIAKAEFDAKKAAGF